MTYVFKFLRAVQKRLGSKPKRQGLDKETQLAKLSVEWADWDPLAEPPEGWSWLRDNSYDGACLVRFNLGSLDFIVRREWRFVRRKHLRATRPAAAPKE